MKLDRRAFAELGAAAKTWLQEASRIERDAAERLAGNSQLAREVALVLLMFEALPFSASVHTGA